MGRLAQADHQIAVHAALALERRDTHARHDNATWSTMRALLDGDEDKARASLASGLNLGQEAHDPDTWVAYWVQRFWIALEWGDEDEQLEMLDHCRERAYRYDDLPWRGALTLALARLGRTDEALRDFDLTFSDLTQVGHGGLRVDILANLAEAAALLGNVERSARVVRHLDGQPPSQLVVIGPAWVCTGSLARYQAHTAAASGAWARADERFRMAVDVHRELAAGPLLARTLREWGSSLVGRDDARAREYLRESDELAARLRLSGLVTPTRAVPAA